MMADIPRVPSPGHANTDSMIKEPVTRVPRREPTEVITGSMQFFIPSEGLFRTQSKEYQESILPAGSKIFGMTAGLPVTLEGLVGANGKVFGMPSFGFSAPYKVLDEKLGYTAENVYKQVKDLLK